MCGLVGIAGNLEWSDKKIFEELMWQSRLRGEDSAGIAIFDGNMNVHIHKQPCDPADFLRLKSTEKFLNSKISKSIGIIGHTRAVMAANREISYEYTHPFQIDHITLAHNGVLRGQGGLKDWDYANRIDSQEISINMAKYGALDTLQQLQGDFALSWFDEKDISLNLARNSGRTLYFAFADKAKKVYWASEAGMLKYILARNSVKIDVDESGMGVYAIDPEIWVSFDLASTDLSKYKINKFKEFSPARASSILTAEEWKDSSAGVSKGAKPHINVATKDRTEEVLGEWGMELGGEDYMLFNNVDRMAADSTRGNITGTICVFGDSKGEDIKVYAIIYCAPMKVWDTVGHGCWAKVRIRGLQKSTMYPNHWIVICEYIEEAKSSSPLASKKEARKSTRQEKKTEPTIYLPDDNLVDSKRPIRLPSPTRPRPPINKRFGYGDIFLDADVWGQKIKYGCYECGEIPRASDHDRLIWVGPDTFVCFGCAYDHNLLLANKILKDSPKKDVADGESAAGESKL